MIHITASLAIPNSEIKLSFIASPGPGGQNVNKVATAVQLRFNPIISPSLSDEIKKRLVLQIGNKLTTQGDLIIKASRFRTQDRNKLDAIARLVEIIKRATIRPKKRKKTKPTAGSIERRLTKKKATCKQEIDEKN